MSTKRPEPGETYRSRLFPRQKCEVLRANEAKVEIQWVGNDTYIDPESITASRFIREFELSLKKDQQ